LLFEHFSDERDFTMRRMLLGTCCGFFVLAHFCGWRADASEPAAGTCSVERLRSVLQSIDPYQPKQSVSGRILIFGSSGMDGLVHAWSENFQEFHPEVQFEISSVSETQAKQRLADEKSAIWFLSRPVSEDEVQQLKSGGLQRPVALEVAKQAMGVFVHPSNPIFTISGQQLRSIFTTEVENEPTWIMMGVTGSMANQAIRIISRKEDSGIQRFLQEHIFGAQMRPGVHVDSSAKVVDAIKQDPLAIGICSLRCGDSTARALNLEAGGSIIPSDDLAIISGQYPLVRPLSIVIDLETDTSNLNLEFARYILSQSGQAESLLAGYFPVDLPLIRAELNELLKSQSK
jgi:phosphate transport system substrate-binding protein